MMESVGVIAIVTLLIFIGLLFYQSFRETSIEENVEELQILDAEEIAERVMDLPELSCSRVEVVEIACFDKLKIKAFTNLTQNKSIALYYFPLLKNSRINITEIYPGFEEYLLYENNGSLSREIPYFTPVTIYDPESHTYSFGTLEVIAFYESAN